MATYFHGGSEIQANSDGTHTLYLMNPNYVPYSDTHSQTPPNMLFLNPSGHALNPSTLPHAPPSNNHFVGIPLSTTDAPRSSYASQSHHEIAALHPMPSQRLHYNLWAPMDQQTHHGISTVSATTDSTDLCFRRPTTQQGLSLSLSSQQSLYRTLSAEQEIQGGGGAPAISPTSGDDIRVSGNSPTSVSVVSSGITGVQSVILGSKYLKAAQELLDEVVNVGKGNYKTDKGDGTKDKMKMKKESTAAIGGEPSGGGETTSKPAAELSTAQRQDLQMKKAKLIGMLDEVEQKYRQYHQQMQAVVNCFEQAAGLGSAKSYASLALETISKQFRCLKDAICAQIKATSKSLGEEDWLGAKIEGSRLRYVDHHLRQQRALQQLGMIQHNTWRPQRGLPERAVSVLRAWLFEHFLHPYPKDSDKIILAKQTGLTRSQVSNWFINARVRLWKPMVEEMYLEEIKEQEQNGDSHDMLRTNKNEPNKQHGGGGGGGGDQINNNNIKDDHAQSKTENLMNNQNNIHASPKKQRTTTAANNNLETPSTKTMLLRDIDTTKHLLQTTAEMNMNHHHYHGGGGGFGAYPVGEIGTRFNSELLTPRFHGNGVSLTLGLPHSDTQHNYHLGRRLDITNGGGPDFSDINPAPPPPPPPHSASTAYDHVEMQTTKRFAAQLLPDFVA
ncbi:BEL1-like homeodomain protein 1 [Cucurbita moschata]|uniref:BEL1-like homeodomain protein 1 n=1 Tax=Cucurbita moschata TaxID=3662 RepID=A0A6J1FVR8_CUCMO|nr:BEL1-like homeodomain protein 1 [Cucurbita moschata]